MMRFITVPAILFFLAAVPQAQALVTLGQSSQTFALTGIGNNAAGLGQNSVKFGTCTFDGFNTNCNISGPFIGLGPGGTYNFLFSYPGSGPFPLNADSVSIGSNLFTFAANSNLGSYNFVITLTETNGTTIPFYSFANFTFQFSGPTCTGVATTACTVSGVGAVPGATLSGLVTGTFDPAPNISPSGAATAANYGGFQAIAPATWIEIYGVNLANVKSQTWGGSDFVGSQAPSALGGTTVTVAGMPAYVDYVSPGQVNVQVPSGIPAGAQPLVVTTAGGSSVPYTILVNTVEPGVLAPNAFFVNGKQNVVALLAGTLTYILPVNVSGAATARAKPGQSLNMYGIGFGTLTPSVSAGQITPSSPLTALTAGLQVTFAGVPATVTFAGLTPGNVGLYQFNVTVPNIPASDTTPVVFTLNGTAVPQSLVIAISN